MLRAVHVASKLSFNMIKNALGIPADSPTDILQKLGGTCSKWSQRNNMQNPGDSSFDDCLPVNKSQMDEVFVMFCSENNIPQDGTEFVASGSIGGVYRATLLGGEVVAVKVRYPGIEEMIESDFGAIENLGSAVDFAGGYNISSSLLQIKKDISMETNYVEEVQNILKIHSLLSGSQLKIRVPAVYEDLCTDNVIVMEYIDAIGVSRYIKYCSEEEQTRICNNILEFFFHLVFNGVILSDPHWGNFMIENKTKSLVAVDFGSVKNVEKENISRTLKLLNIANDRPSWEKNFRRYAVSDLGFDKQPSDEDIDVYYGMHLEIRKWTVQEGILMYRPENIDKINQVLKFAKTSDTAVAIMRALFTIVNICSYCRIDLNTRELISRIWENIHGESDVYT